MTDIQMLLKSPRMRYDADRSALAHPARGAQLPALLKRRVGSIGDLTVIDVGSEPGWSGLVRRLRNRRRIVQAKGAVLLVQQRPLHDYQSVVVAVDFSPHSMSAARAALTFAKGARFRFVHVMPAADPHPIFDFGNRSQITQALRRKGREIATDELDRFVAMLGIETPVKRIVLHGDPVPTIASYARDIGADLLVCAPDSGPLWKQMLRPSIPIQLPASGCDVLIAGAHASDQTANAGYGTDRALTEEFRPPILGRIHPRPTLVRHGASL